MRLLGGARIMKSTDPIKYIFVDGNYLVQRLREIERLSGFSLVANLDVGRMAARYDRLFYYDALPIRRNNSADGSFEAELAAKNEFLNKIRKSGKCHVRDGLTEYRSASQSSLRQKGVDIRLAVDVMLHALQSQVDLVTILTGDLDFFPVFESLQHSRTRSEVLYFNRSIAAELLHLADFGKEVDVLKIRDWLSPSYSTALQEDYPSQWVYWSQPMTEEAVHRRIEGTWGLGDMFYLPSDGLYYVKWDTVGNAEKCRNDYVFYAHLLTRGVDVDLQDVKAMRST